MTSKTRGDVGGLEARFRVLRVDGAPIAPHKRYFVFDISGDDPEARVAVWVYAFLKWLFGKNRRLFKDVSAALKNPEGAPAQH